MYLAPVVISFTKFLGSKMGIRLLVLVIAGLAALYTIHLLAQDFMKIRMGTKVAARLLLGKREIADPNRNITREEIDFEDKIDWEKVLNRDPLNCALSLICQLSAGAEKDNKEANVIFEFIS
jgi:hypothetical protein